MKTNRLLVVVGLIAALALIGCTSNASDKIDGRWVIDVQKSRNYPPPTENNDSIIEMGKNMVEKSVQSIMEDTELTFNTKEKTVSGKLFGLSISNKQYGIVQDSTDACTIVVITEKLTLTPKADTLTIQREDGGLYYFNKVK